MPFGTLRIAKTLPNVERGPILCWGDGRMVSGVKGVDVCVSYILLFGRVKQ
jgi:hypothetical protein